MMRRIVAFAGLALLAWMLAACKQNNNEVEIKALSQADLSEREDAILAATADQYMVFDFDMGKERKTLNVWVEKYQFGELVGEVNWMSAEVEEKGAIVFVKLKRLEESKEAIFSISIGNDGGTGATWGPDALKEDDFDYAWSNHPSGRTVDGKIVLGAICYKKTNEGEGFSSLTTRFFEAPDNHMDELKEYDIVYLLRSEFK